MKDKKKEIAQQINQIIEEIINENEPKENDLEIKIIEYFTYSEKMLDDISAVKKLMSDKDDYGEQHISDFENKNRNDIQEIEYLITSSVDSGVNKLSYFVKLQHNYHRIINSILECKTLIFSKKVVAIDKKLDAMSLKSENIESKFEGIGSTILSTIVSLTVVVTAISAIEKIPEKYIPLYLISIVWLAMTLIVFINNLFNKNDFNNKQAVFMYGVISILEFIILMATQLKV